MSVWSEVFLGVIAVATLAMAIAQVGVLIAASFLARRVALDPNLLHTLELNEGDKVRVELDIDTATILIRKDAGAASKRYGMIDEDSLQQRSVLQPDQAMSAHRDAL